ncbi:MAG: hypothetical protein RLZZ244_2390 [Verrucomicrobiota bacterium]|jgi:molybdate/tungstate transport system ATP-binding protein
MIRFENIAWRTEGFALENISFTVPAKTYGVLMGKTGSGKTCLVEMLCGLRCPDAGRIFLGQRDLTSLPPGERRIGYVPQDAALFPTLSVRDNMGFALRIRRRPKAEIAATVESWAEQLSLTALLERFPEHLSGGERQRVALARALAAQPDALVLDEPLSALDDPMRLEITKLLGALQKRLALTVLHITHHPREALQLAHHVFHLEQGSITVSPHPRPQGEEP